MKVRPGSPFGENAKGYAFTAAAAAAKTAASASRPRSASGRSHAKYAAMNGNAKKLRLRA